MVIQVENLAALPKAAAQLLEIAQGRRVFLLYGSMGAGKTTFIKAICEQLGVKDATSSPTFSIVNEYISADGRVYHFDFYRIKSEREAYDMGYEEYFYSGEYCFVEWPDKIPNILPDDAVAVHLTVLPDGRRQLEISQ